MLDWREYDFFRSIGGLKTTNDTPECALAYDYELAHDCPPLCTQIAACPNAVERGLAWASSMPYQSRWFGNLTPGIVPERPELEPLIPTACLLAPWFPSPWLAGSFSERRAVMAALERAYTPVRPLMLRRHPLNEATERILTTITSGHGHYTRTEILFDRTASPGKLINQFRKALLEPGLLLPPSNRKRHVSPVRSLEQLCCYRLGLILPVADRDVAAAGIAHLPKGLTQDRLSKARKHVRTNFSERHYILPVSAKIAT
jgi:hypothetical protein